MANETLPQLTPRNLTEAIDLCERLAKTNFVPKDYQNKPGEILAAIQFGAEVGLGPMQALQSIAVINGRPSLWGDALLALVQKSGLLEYINETSTADSATCEVKRKGDKSACKVTFSHADAVRAGLAGKAGPWQHYPSRMRCMRARGFALRNKFADVLKGLISGEEAQDYDVETTAIAHETALPTDDLPTSEQSAETKQGAGMQTIRDAAPVHKPLTLVPDSENRPINDAEENEIVQAVAKQKGVKLWDAMDLIRETIMTEQFGRLDDLKALRVNQITPLLEAIG